MATLTLRNVPDELVERLKGNAARNRRSLNQEVICQLLEGGPRYPDSDEILRDIDELVAELEASGEWILPEDVDRWIEEGRR